jgi:hypothetical protein
MGVRKGRISLWIACVVLGAFPWLRAADVGFSEQAPVFRLERMEVPSGAELVTLFSTQPAQENARHNDPDIPIFSVLRDTLNDADRDNDRLRQVWIYGYAKPSIWQRFVACLPFVYRQASPKRYRSDGLPRAAVDLSAPGKNTVYDLVGEAIQIGVLDDFGLPLRLASRSYRGSAKDYRDLQIYQTLLALSDFQKSASAEEYLTDEDMEKLGARLLLSTRLLGGIVGEAFLQSAWEKENLKSNQNRGHNWELLRQKAEANGLYFEPLVFGEQEQKFALLWIDQSSVSDRSPKSFQKDFLGISNPFGDKRLVDWDGYTQVWHFDEAGVRVAEGLDWARKETMIPLALYALDHPRTPLLLIDMRQSWKPGTKERARRIATDLTGDLLRLTPVTSWQFTIAKTTLFFVKSRHGAALNRSARLRAYAQLQHSLKLDSSLDPELRSQIARFSQRLGLNPFDRKPDTQIDMAQQQYSALLEFAKSPAGLAARLEKDRAGELSASGRSVPGRVFFKFADITTLGLFPRREKVDAAGYLGLDQYRRFSYHKRVLQRAVDPSAQSDVADNPDGVRRSLDAMFELGRQNTKLLPAAQGIVSSLFKKADNDLVSRQCAASLIRFQDITEAGKPSRTSHPGANAESIFLKASKATAFR